MDFAPNSSDEPFFIPFRGVPEKQAGQNEIAWTAGLFTARSYCSQRALQNQALF